jgi:phosphoribosylanthranilate isomerase
MTWVKICGITNLEDALTAVDAGADALGFVFYEKSPRNVALDVAREIIAKLPHNVEKVGVLVDLSAEQKGRIIHSVDLTGVQMVNTVRPPIPTPDMSVAVGLRPGMKAYFTFHARQLIENGRWIENKLPPELLDRFGGIVLDSGEPEQPGGTGKVFDWARAASLVQTMSKNFRVIVAGGLTSSNVTEAMRTLKPWGVDVSSGVEARPGKKDPAKVRDFIAAVREEDKKQ